MQLTALAAIIALVLGGKVLGIAGMILAVPAIGVMKIMLAYSRRLRPFVILMGDVDKEDVAQDPTEQTPPVKAVKARARQKKEKIE